MALARILKFTLTIITASMLFFASFDSAGAKIEGANHPVSRAFADPKTILFRRGAVDTRAQIASDTSSQDRITFEKGIAAQSLGNKQLRIIQFAGAIEPRWLERLKTAGAEIVDYVPNNAYLIRGNAEQLAGVAGLDAGEDADDKKPIRWMGRLQPLQKIAPELDGKIHAGEGVAVEIELLDSPESASAIQYIESVRGTGQSGKALPQRRFLRYVVLSVTLPASAIESVAALDEVLFIAPVPQMRLEGERDAQIIAGNLTADRTQPVGAGYAAWLASKGLDRQGDTVIDFTDSGIDRGSTSASLLHPDFLNAQGGSRLAYVNNYTADTGDRGGHGTMVASIACGSGTDGLQDAAGYLYGLGVDPFARLGSSRIFADNGKQPAGLSYSAVISAAYAVGVRISNNSWGNSSNAYDVLSQEYDALVRDAQPGVPGNQEMVIVFSGGNSGPGGHISEPGTAKNVITVGASESYLPEGTDSCDFNAMGAMGPADADSALDIARFSSGGPTNDGRAKPDIVAPGTHIHGAASQSPFFIGAGLCPGVPLFQPPTQQLYTWSSGTSLSAPHVTGAASLLRKFFIQKNLLNGQSPSPAMTKAFFINSASYLCGADASGNLPQERQGFGLLNLAKAFDDTPRKLVDQTQLFTGSGQSFEIHGSLADRTQPLRVTLAWTDAPGSLIGAALVNDLDLEIHIGNTTYRGNNFDGAFSVTDGSADRLNNVESVVIRSEWIPAGADGNFTITVRAANIAGDGVPNNATGLDQDFALVATNFADSGQPPPPDPKPVITNATYVKKTLTVSGHDFTAAAQVEINGRAIDLPFNFDATTNSLSLRMKAKKLKLNADADNQIVLIEKNERSQPFTLRL